MKYLLGTITCIFIVIVGFINGSHSKVKESEQVHSEYKCKLQEYRASSDSLKVNIIKLERLNIKYIK